MLHQQMLGSLFTRSRLTSLRPFRLHQGNAASVIRSPQAHLRDYESNRPKLVSFASTCVIVLSYASVVQKEARSGSITIPFWSLLSSQSLHMPNGFGSRSWLQQTAIFIVSLQIQ
ncbi:hypothetical protein BS50DRAFT_52405 [Corynespora cassiicola Philippines]|uniref:Uncharacterized protein n=1 Tax=Corynespora cassiicola Philippines TaxID=1448308 RepID=A0A2T2NI94_CORCC|nr:hypothetical protein BS50DRAFT_52405 [Corynespora cassiicola Philippines]